MFVKHYNTSAPLSEINELYVPLLCDKDHWSPSCALVGIDQTPTSRLGAAYLVECIHRYRDVTVYDPSQKYLSPRTRIRRTLDQCGQGVGCVVVVTTMQCRHRRA